MNSSTQSQVATLGLEPPSGQGVFWSFWSADSTQFPPESALGAECFISSFGSVELALPEGVKSALELTCLLSASDSLLFEGFRELLVLSSEAHGERIAEEGLPGLYVDPVL